MKIIDKKLLQELECYDLWEETVEIELFAEVINDDDSGEAATLIDTINSSRGKLVTSIIARTKDGQYIGDQDLAIYLVEEYGIVPERDGIVEDKDVPCRIGFSEKSQKWYGWSHRAIYGFTIGDIVEKGDCCASSGWTDEYIAKHPEEDLSLPVGFKAKTLEDAKRMAIAFANNVG